MGIWCALAITVLLVILPIIGTAVLHLDFLFAVLLPYVSGIIFLLGLIWRVIYWAKSPVPFRIPTTGGQQKSLPWIQSNALDNPSTKKGVWGRMLLEFFFFRSLLRSTKMKVHEGPKLAYYWEKWLWLGGLCFHWSFFIILFRHLRFFTDPVPQLVTLIEGLDGFLQVGVRALYITDILILLALTYLFFRRVIIPQIRSFSIFADYFSLFLIFAIACSGVLMRYFWHVDVIAVKEWGMGMVAFQPLVPEGLGALFFVHLFLVCSLLIYFPFSKLVHGAGLLFSPTRNLANNNRAERHPNPWNYPVKVHTYEEYEEEFKDKMKAAGLPLEREEE